MGKIILVGLGPGDREFMTGAAWDAMESADVIAGYTLYVDLVKDHFPGKDFYSTPMKKETERCQWVIDRAKEGSNVAFVCSGDAGIYGMAGLILELMAEEKEDSLPDVQIVPGITAAISGAAVLGAPLMNDFSVISLSDLMTPWEVIEKRLDCAAAGDFSIAMYNVASHKRKDHLKNACDILLRHKSPDTVCGFVRNIGREGQSSSIMTLKELREAELDMFCTVFIGQATTRVIHGRMVTPRGYKV